MRRVGDARKCGRFLKSGEQVRRADGPQEKTTLASLRVFVSEWISTMFLIVNVNVLTLNLKRGGPPGNVLYQYLSIEFVILCCHIPFL
jgi:hypothetical protein